MNPQDYCFPHGYQALRALSCSSPVFLCRENASERLLVVKLSPLEKESAFHKEVRALAELENFPASPRLYFASSLPDGVTPLCAGMEYRHGRSLLELRGTLDHEGLSSLQQSVRTCLESLHRQWGIAHGDLSPKNILAQPSDDRPSQWLVTLVDWEFSEKVKDQNLSTYSHYRGTVGFSRVDAGADPFLRDWQAFEACIKFMSPEQDTSARPKKKTWGLHWLKRI